MAKHSKYDNIKHRKAAQDARKWKKYSLYAKLITLAAQSEWDPEKNPNLFNIIEKAKKEWVPNENIDRAIKKWTWENKDWTIILEIFYEWYAPGWVAIIVKTLTDNKNRTASSIRHIFAKYWWNMWESWVVSWIFKKKWIIVIDKDKNKDKNIEELIFETSAEDFKEEDNIFIITTNIEDLYEVTKFLEQQNIIIEESELDYIGDNEVEMTDFDNVLKFKKMVEAFENDEDVEAVFSNEIIDEKLENDVLDFIEKNTFRT